MAFWLIQALTGIVCVFHWEIDDALLAAPHRPTELAAIDRRIAALTPAGSGWAVASIWTSAGAPDRWDISLDNTRTGASKAVRIDGAGTVLRVRDGGETLRDGAWLDSVVLLHQRLLAGDVGSWIVGVSGVLLFTNILGGLILAWPKRGTARRALTPPKAGRLPARLYGWHRALGLWLGIPAALLVSAGVARVFADGFERMIGAPPISVPAEPPQGPSIPFSRAAGAALARHPGAALAGIGFPTPDNALWSIRLRLPGEPVRAYGNSLVFVSGRDGHVVADFPANTAPLSRRFANIVLPFHTGELGGYAGRIAVLALGVWLVAMLVLGAMLWWTRRGLRKGVRP